MRKFRVLFHGAVEVNDGNGFIKFVKDIITEDVTLKRGLQAVPTTFKSILSKEGYDVMEILAWSLIEG